MSIPAYVVPTYTFLSQPPPPKKQRAVPVVSAPTQPLPALPNQAQYPPGAYVRRRSSTFAAIATWAAHVQPGTPAPYSPGRRSTRRRPSVIRAPPSASFLNLLDTPSTAYSHPRTPASLKDFDKQDLTALGYAAVFVRLPTPTSPCSAAPKLSSPRPAAHKSATHPPVPKLKRGLKQFRSLTTLKPLKNHIRAKSAGPATPPPQASMPKPAPPPLPLSNPADPASPTSPPAPSSGAVVRQKRAKYAVPRPPPLAQELALLQFMEGGTLEGHARRVCGAQGTAAHVGADGGLWWDADEELEYAHLLARGEEARGDGWVRFDSPGRERGQSVSSQGSPLSMREIVQERDDDLAAFASVPSASVLSTPPRRPSHPSAPAPALPSSLKFTPPRSPLSSRPLRSTPSPRSPKFGAGATVSAPLRSAHRKTRRRPAPLTLAPRSPADKRPSNSPPGLADARRAFAEDAFAPAPAPRRRAHGVPPPPPPVLAEPAAKPAAVGKKPSRFGMLFKAVQGNTAK